MLNLTPNYSEAILALLRRRCVNLEMKCEQRQSETKGTTPTGRFSPPKRVHSTLLNLNGVIDNSSRCGYRLWRQLCSECHDGLYGIPFLFLFRFLSTKADADEQPTSGKTILATLQPRLARIIKVEDDLCWRSCRDNLKWPTYEVATENIVELYHRFAFEAQ